MKLDHATQLFLLALASLAALVFGPTPDAQLAQLLREVVLAALVGGSVAAVPSRGSRGADVTVSGPVTVDTAAAVAETPDPPVTPTTAG